MYIDGLQCSNFDRSVLKNLRRGRLACITNTLAFWEDTTETMDRIGRWRDLARENADLVAIARSVREIIDTARSGRTAVLLGCQNTSPLADRLRFVELFWDMGMRVMQLTYNNQNAYGSSCYEPNDGGLSRGGRELVREMNRVGMVIDLSHVGNRTAREVIEWSEKPVAITHANPASLFRHPRNKPDDVLRALTERGGVLGLATYRNICGKWADTAESWCEMAERSLELVGAEHVAIGTDLSERSGEKELDWMRRGRWTRDVDYGAGSAAQPGKVLPPQWFANSGDFPAIEQGLLKRGLDAATTRGVMSGNWLRMYRDVFGEADVELQPLDFEAADA